MHGLAGVKSKELLIWVTISEIVLSPSGTKIVFRTPAGLGRAFPVRAQVARVHGGAGPPRRAPPAAQPGRGGLQPVDGVRVAAAGRRPDPHLRLHRQAGVVRQGGDGVRGARADARPRRGEEQGAPHLGHRLPARARGGGGGPQGGGRGRRRRRRQLICSSFRRRRPCVGCSIR
uniref:Uncharacterized protein n=1 Tax=Zea mays TaxID=4577 RepID=B4FCB8_MAIZE|nr:unknown [Zea mays]